MPLLVQHAAHSGPCSYNTLLILVPMRNMRMCSCEQVVYKALETLSYLCSHSKENRELLSQQPGLMPRLNEIGEMHPTEEVADLAKHLYIQISSDKPVDPVTPEKAVNRPALAALAANNLERLRTQSSPASKNMHSRQPRTMMFKVEGLAGVEDKDKLEKCIIRTKGVISVSLDQVELGDSAVMRILAQRQITGACAPCADSRTRRSHFAEVWVWVCAHAQT